MEGTATSVCDVEVSDRQRSSLATMIKAVATAKETIEEHKFEKGDSGDKVTKWGEPIEEVITDADANVRRLTSHIQEIASEVEATERADKRKAQLEFERAQLIYNARTSNTRGIAKSNKKRNCYNRSSNISRC